MIKKIGEDLRNLGIEKGDVLMVHSSFKSLGNIDGGAKTFIDSVLSYLGENGTLLMPAFSYTSVTLDSPYFNLKETPSCVGYLPEYFRTQTEGVFRSIHATHSCCAKGKYAKILTYGHEMDETPVGNNSPLIKLLDYGGKILFIGCSTDRNTLMHGVEEIADAPYCINRERIIEYVLDNGDGNIIKRKSYRHSFVIDGVPCAQRYSRIEQLLAPSEYAKGKILQADCTVMSARAVMEKGVEKLRADPWFFVDRIV